jgi:hypothetical protein
VGTRLGDGVVVHRRERPADRNSVAGYRKESEEDAMDDPDQPQIEPTEIEQVMALLNEALGVDGVERVGRLGLAVRALTRIWSDANPTFDGDAWYPVSYLLGEHWNEIQSHMER